jgi:hypothetical protein
MSCVGFILDIIVVSDQEQEKNRRLSPLSKRSGMLQR